MRMKKILLTALPACLVLLGGCSRPASDHPDDNEDPSPVTENQEAVAEEDEKPKQRSLRPRLLSVNARTNNVSAVKASSEVPVEEEVTEESHEDDIEEQDEASPVVQAEEQIIEEVQPIQTRTVVEKGRKAKEG